jgi:hypothetical protein
MLNQLKNFGEKMSMVVRAFTLGETLKNLDFLYYLYEQLPAMLLNHRIEWEQEKTVDRVQLQEHIAGRLPPGSIGVRPILRTTAEAEGQRLNYLAIIARDLIAGAKERDMQARRAECRFDKMFGEKKFAVERKIPEQGKASVGQFFNIETNGVMTKDETIAMAEKIFPSGEQSPPYVQVTPPVSAEPATGDLNPYPCVTNAENMEDRIATKLAEIDREDRGKMEECLRNAPPIQITKDGGVLNSIPSPVQAAFGIVPDGLHEELSGSEGGKILPDPNEGNEKAVNPLSDLHETESDIIMDPSGEQQ